eukprot:2386186-Amphidinium_carterae.1
MNDKNFLAHAIARQKTVNMLKSQLEPEKANVETAVKRQLHSERKKMKRDIQAQQEVTLGQI